jgi:glycosyltransferase AglI
MPAISIIIPVFQNPEGLRSTLGSFAESHFDHADEIIVVNDGADPLSEAIISSFKSLPLRLLNVPESKGSYHARNSGLHIATNEFVLFADAGLIFPEETVDQIKALLSSYDYVAANVAVLKSAEESLAEKYYRLTAFKIEDMFRRFHAGGAGFLAVRAAVIRSSGAFNEDLYSGADNEFGLRVHKQGFSQHFESKLLACHASRNWSSQFRVLLRIYKGRKMLSKLKPNDYRQMNFTFSDLLIFPFKSIRSIYRNLRDRKVLFNSELTLFETLLASTIHHSLVFLAMLIILIFPKKNFNLR